MIFFFVLRDWAVCMKTNLFFLKNGYFNTGKHMKRRRFYENAPFHLNGNWRQSLSDFKSVLQFARVLVWSLVLDFFNQVPNWPTNFYTYAIKPLIQISSQKYNLTLAL